MTFLPSSLRRFQPPRAPAPVPAPELPPTPEPAPGPEHAPVPGAVGYVVVICPGYTGKPQHLTNADLMDLGEAETEARGWRTRPRDPMIARGRYVVCAVVPLEEL